MKSRLEDLQNQPSGKSMSFKIKIPASSANLGPGFDSLALAYKLYCSMQVKILEKDDPAIPRVSFRGKILEGLSFARNNKVDEVLRSVLAESPELLRRVRFCVESEIPLGRGLGSSAAAITGALWAASILAGRQPETGDILLRASALEGHADNAAASLLGGLVITAPSSNSKRIFTQKLSWPSEWCTLLTVPDYALSTKKARAVLPEKISRSDAIMNLQKTALLISALQNRDADAMREALQDRLHEPYRMELVPHLARIRKFLCDYSTIGTVLSGAGSSVLTIVHERQRRQVLDGLRTFCSAGLPGAQVLDLSVDQEGLTVSYDQVL